MVNSQIVLYVQQELQQGYSLQGISQYLINSGYPHQEVNEAIQYVQNTQQRPDIARQQRTQQLSKYVQQQLNAGYPQETLRNFLIQKGYPQQEVDGALNGVQSEVAVDSHAQKSNQTVIALVVVLIFAMVVFGVIILQSGFLKVGEGKLLDLKTVKLTSTPKPGSDLVFKVELYNMGAKRRFDILLTYELEDSIGNIIASSTESMAIDTSTSKLFSLEIPEDTNPGNYSLRIVAEYDDKIAEAGLLFKVYAPDTTISKEEAKEDVVEIPSTVTDKENKSEDNLTEETIEDSIEEKTEDSIEKPTENFSEKEQKIIAPTVEEKKGLFVNMTRKEAFNIIKRTGARNPQKAVELCNEFNYDITIERCYSMLAIELKNGDFCDVMLRNSSKDSCYIQSVLSNGDAELCEQIIDDSVKKSCKSLTQMRSLQKSMSQDLNSSTVFDSLNGTDFTKVSSFS